MSDTTPTCLPGDKLRKAVQEYAELRKSKPELTSRELIELVCRKFDLTPLEADFLFRQLQST